MLLRRVVIRPRHLLVAQNELIVYEKLLLNGLKRSTNAGVGGWKEPNKREQQQARVDRLGTISLHKTAELTIKTPFANVSVDFVGDFAWTLGASK